MTREKGLALVCGMIGLVSLGNGLWMLLSSTTWFDYIPAAMHDTGPPNSHLIHDVGLAYLTVGGGLLWCARNLRRGRAVFLGATFFMVGHALSHVAEMLLGQLPHTHWYIDVPLVFLPALVLGALAVPSVWRYLLADASTG